MMEAAQLSLPMMSVPLDPVAASVYEQTGWKRHSPQAICQDHMVLQAITAYSYNLQDADFQQYLQTRIGLDVAAQSENIHFLAGSEAEEWMESSPDWVYPQGPAVSQERRQNMIIVYRILRGNI